MTAALPPARPRMTRAELHRRIAPHRIDRKRHPLVIVGVRGYYADSLGAPGRNDRGIYDDALFIDGPDAFAAFNANTDPSRVRPGKGAGAARGMACLQPGAWFVHRFDLHKGQYLALCQRLGPVTVLRDGHAGAYSDTGHFGINIHKGGVATTSSEGCQTVPPAQWPAFVALARDQAERAFGPAWKETVIPYVLLGDGG